MRQRSEPRLAIIHGSLVSQSAVSGFPAQGCNREAAAKPPLTWKTGYGPLSASEQWREEARNVPILPLDGEGGSLRSSETEGVKARSAANPGGVRIASVSAVPPLPSPLPREREFHLVNFSSPDSFPPDVRQSAPIPTTQPRPAESPRPVNCARGPFALCRAEI